MDYPPKSHFRHGRQDLLPFTIDIVVFAIGAALRLYRALGLPAPTGWENELQVQIANPGVTLGLLTGAIMEQTNLFGVNSFTQRLTFGRRCDMSDEVNATKAGGDANPVLKAERRPVLRSGASAMPCWATGSTCSPPPGRTGRRDRLS